MVSWISACVDAGFYISGFCFYLGKQGFKDTTKMIFSPTRKKSLKEPEEIFFGFSKENGKNQNPIQRNLQKISDKSGIILCRKFNFTY